MEVVILKKFIIPAVSAALLFSAIPIASASPAAKNPTTSTSSVTTTQGSIKPRAQLIDQHSTFSGQGYVYFKYSNNYTTGESVRTYIKNEGTSTITYNLKDPSGYSWQSGTLSAGESYTSTYTWSITQAGNWTYELNTSDGGSGSAWISVRSGV